MLASKVRSFTLTKRQARVHQRATLQRRFQMMRRCWKMYAITCEAFIAQVSVHLDHYGLSGYDLYVLVLATPGTSRYDVNRARSDLDEVFAHKTIDAALKMLEGSK